MEVPSYIKEAIETVKFANETTHSVDGFIIKLESAISHILEFGEKNELELFFNLLVERGLLNRLSCYKENLNEVLSSPRHSLIRNYSDLLYAALEQSPCVGSFKYIIPPPSHDAGQISWGKSYRDLRRKPPSIIDKITNTIRVNTITLFTYLLLIFLISLLIYSIYLAIMYTNLSKVIKITVIKSKIEKSIYLIFFMLLKKMK